MGIQVALKLDLFDSAKNLSANAGDTEDTGLIPWRKAWQPTSVFLPREFHGQRSLEGYSPWGHKESDPTRTLHNVVINILYTIILIMGCPTTFKSTRLWKCFPCMRIH